MELKEDVQENVRQAILLALQIEAKCNKILFDSKEVKECLTN